MEGRGGEGGAGDDERDAASEEGGGEGVVAEGLGRPESGIAANSSRMRATSASSRVRYSVTTST